MATTLKKVELWSIVVDNKPGALAAVLEPLADAGADLEVVMATAIPGDGGKASIGVFPVKGRKVIAAARAAGLAPAVAMPSLLVGGDNRAGLGGRMSEALAAAGINIGVAVAQVVENSFSALFGFASQEDATKAVTLIKKVTTVRKAAAKPAAAKRAPAKKKPAATARRPR